jgi:hypothetical protein
VALKETSLEAIGKMSRRELKRTILMCFEYAPDADPIDRLAVLQEAQFYTQELERRSDSLISLRDLLLEVAVIGLISWEIWIGYQTEQMQSQNFERETNVLSALATSSSATADRLAELKEVTGKMNEGIQTELALNYDVTVEVTFDNSVKHVNIANKGRTNVYIWGDKVGDDPPTMETKGRMIAPGGYYYILADKFYEEVGKRLPKGSEKLLPLTVYLKNDHGNEFSVECQFFAVWYLDNLTIHTQTASIKRARFPK